MTLRSSIAIRSDSARPAVALTVADELLELDARPFLRHGGASALQGFGAVLHGGQFLELNLLLDIERNQLIAGLADLQIADGGLGPLDQPTEFVIVGLEIAHHLGLEDRKSTRLNS